MNDRSDVGWPEANQEWLSQCVAALKAAMHSGSEPFELPVADAPVFAQRPPTLYRIVQSFGLSSFERSLLLLCAGIELDPELGAICAAAHGDATRPYPTFSLALATCPDAHWSALGPGAPLRRWRLIEVTAGQPLTTAQLRIDETVLHCLAGFAELDRRLATLLLPLPQVDLTALAPSHAMLAQRIAAGWAAAADQAAAPLVQLNGDSIDCRPIIAAAASLLGLRAAVLTPDRVPANVDEMEDVVHLWGREICLSGFGVLQVDRDGTDAPAIGDAHTLAHPLARLLERLPGYLALCEQERTRVSYRLVAPFDVPPAPVAEQRQA